MVQGSSMVFRADVMDRDDDEEDDVRSGGGRGSGAH